MGVFGEHPLALLKQSRIVRKGIDSGSSMTWVQIPALPFAKLCKLRHFLHLQSLTNLVNESFKRTNTFSGDLKSKRLLLLLCLTPSHLSVH